LNRLYPIVLSILLVSMVACNAMPAPRKNVRLTLTGSDSMTWMANAVATAYMQHYPNVAINVQSSNSDTGLRATQELSGTIGLVARVVKPSELTGTRAVVVARDGIAVIINRANPINSMQRSQVTDVFSGKILTWPLGPSAGKFISVVSREDGSGTRDAFEAMAMNGARVTRTAIVMPSEAAVVDYVSRTPEAIGYVSMGALTNQIQAMTIDDIPLSVETVESQKYPFVRTFSLIVPSPLDPDTQEFIDFVLSAEGQRIIAQRHGHAP
jgi:phosphate transport system substrate-binding protein